VLPFTLTVNYSGNGKHPQVFTASVGTGRVDSEVTTFTYSGAPVAIPDGDPTGVDVPLDVTFGNVASLSFRINGETFSTATGATTVGVDHSWVGDLTFKLTSPGGKSVTVIDQAGGPLNSGNNFCQTVLEDGAAESIQDVTFADAPFTGTFAPNQAQSGFAGEAGNGTWLLHVSDAALFDTGSVRSFSVDVAGFSCSATP